MFVFLFFFRNSFYLESSLSWTFFLPQGLPQIGEVKKKKGEYFRDSEVGNNFLNRLQNALNKNLNFGKLD